MADRAGAELGVHVGTWKESGWPHWQQDVNNLPGHEFFFLLPPPCCSPTDRKKVFPAADGSGAPGLERDAGLGPWTGGSGDAPGLDLGVQPLIPWLLRPLTSAGPLQPPGPWLGWWQEPPAQAGSAVGTGHGATRPEHPVLSPVPPSKAATR